MRLTLRSDLSGFLPPVSAACGGQTVQVRLVPRNRGQAAVRPKQRPNGTGRQDVPADDPDPEVCDESGVRQSQQATIAPAINAGPIGTRIFQLRSAGRANATPAITSGPNAQMRTCPMNTW